MSQGRGRSQQEGREGGGVVWLSWGGGVLLLPPPLGECVLSSLLGCCLMNLDLCVYLDEKVRGVSWLIMR